MKFVVGMLLFWLTWPALAADKITAVTIEGISYVQIQDAHVVSGGRIVILYPSGGTTVTADKVPKDFLDSWNITPTALKQAKADTEKLAELSLGQAIRAGYFRDVEGLVYDLRKPQPGWVQFSGVKILQVTEEGAMVDPYPNTGTPSAIFVRNLSRIFAVNQTASFMAKSAGDFSYMNKFGFEHTLRAFDVGRVCARNEIPAVVLSGVQSAALSPVVARRTPEHHAKPRGFPEEMDRPGETSPERPPMELPGGSGLRGTGSGFFVTRDGYLLTNFHVVKDAARMQVKYKLHLYEAQLVEVDTVNDLALLKVAGTGFSPLAISHQASADLGDEVFTIGFPNIQMQGLQPKYTDGKISSLAGIQDDPSEYQISVPVQPGNSGGPLCDVKGEVVGIVVARLDDIAVLRANGTVPQNVNYAVKAKLALRLLRNVQGVEGLLKPASAATAVPIKPVQQVEEAIAMVMIY